MPQFEFDPAKKGTNAVLSGANNRTINGNGVGYGVALSLLPFGTVGQVAVYSARAGSFGQPMLGVANTLCDLNANLGGAGSLTINHAGTATANSVSLGSIGFAFGYGDTIRVKYLSSTQVAFSKNGGSYGTAITHGLVGTLYVAVVVLDTADTVTGIWEDVVSGSLTVTEQPDTLSALGAVRVSAALAVTEAADTLASNGAVRISGSLAVTETNDTLAAFGGGIIVISASITEAADSLAAVGAVSISGTLAVTEGLDGLSASVLVSAYGGLAVTEASDIIAAMALLGAFGTVAANDNADSLDAYGTVRLAPGTYPLAIRGHPRVIASAIGGRP